MVLTGRILPFVESRDTLPQMATITVRRFAISLEPHEVVDFSSDLGSFAEVFLELGFEQVSTYTFRYADAECMIKTELKRSQDGYYLFAFVQAMDEHAYRLREVAEAFDAHVVEGARVPA